MGNLRKIYKQLRQIVTKPFILVTGEGDCECPNQIFETNSEFEDFIKHYEQALTEIGFLDPQNPRQLMARSRRFFSRARMDKQELNILRGVLSQMQLTQKKILD